MNKTYQYTKLTVKCKYIKLKSRQIKIFFFLEVKFKTNIGPFGCVMLKLTWYWPSRLMPKT